MEGGDQKGVTKDIRCINDKWRPLRSTRKAMMCVGAGGGYSFVASLKSFDQSLSRRSTVSTPNRGRGAARNAGRRQESCAVIITRASTMLVP